MMKVVQLIYLYFLKLVGNALIKDKREEKTKSKWKRF